MHPIPALLALLAMVPASCAAQSATPDNRQTWMTTADTRLDEMRGGFALAPGLTVSFGILRTVEINGSVVSSTGFQIADLRTISVAQAEQLARQVNQLSVVQNGAGNSLATALASGMPGLLVQNTLNDQKIRTITEINAVTNGLSILKGMNLSQSLNDAINAATRR
jgi:hypothetical protein